MKNKYLIALITILFVCRIAAQNICAQQRPVGRFVQRILQSVNGGSEYRVESSGEPNTTPQNTGEKAREPARGEKIAENVLSVVRQFVQNGNTDNNADNTGNTAVLKPIAVISLASFNEFKRVVQTAAKRIRESENSSEEPAALNAFLSFYETVVQNGFDTEQPLGFILQTDGLLYYPLFFTPLNLESNFGKQLKEHYTETTEDGRTVLKAGVIPYPFGMLYVRQYKGWAFIATEKQLNSLPDDPTILLEGLGTEKLFAARFYLNNLPKLTTGTALAFAEVQAVSGAKNEAEKASARLFISYLRSLAEQADFLEYSLFYDAKEGDYVIQQKETVKPGTEQAKMLAKRRDKTSPLQGFYYPENAAIAGHFCTFLTKAQRVNLETILQETLGKQILTEQEQDVINKKIDNNNIKPESVQQDPRDKLAQLLAKDDVADLNISENNNIPLPELKLNEMPTAELTAELTNQKKIELILRRVAACYYWGLLGSIRKGEFDNAFTVSQEHGILCGFTVADERFQKMLDEVFAEIAAQFPDVYKQSVIRNYAEESGFQLTKISFFLSDILQESVLKNLFSFPDTDREKISIIFGVHKKMVCFAVGSGDTPEQELRAAIQVSEKSLPVYDIFFVYSAYEAGQMFAKTGNQGRFLLWKQIAANRHPEANAYAKAEWADTEKTITLRISDLLTPSFWRLSRNIRGR